ncbi:MAG: hypothetical protein RSA74_13305 [Chryseobacterium sp.]
MKIQKLINSCSDCEFAKEYQEVSGNTSFVLICNYEEDENENFIKNPFLIDQSHSKIKQYHTVEIPKQCPLEDYEYRSSNPRN